MKSRHSDAAWVRLGYDWANYVRNVDAVVPTVSYIPAAWPPVHSATERKSPPEHCYSAGCRYVSNQATTRDITPATASSIPASTSIVGDDATALSVDRPLGLPARGS